MNFNFCKFGIAILIWGALSCSGSFEKQNDVQVFRYNEHANISSLDPAFAKNQANIWAVNQLFNGLVQLDDSLRIQPDIAKTWTISSDGLRYCFRLRKDVFFHKHPAFHTKDSTRQVTAFDFEYSFTRLIDKKTSSPGQWVLQNVESFSAANDSVFDITLKKVFPPFLGLLTTKYCSVVPREVVARYKDDFRSHPIGTGPFQFKLWVENIKLVFRKNPLYYEKDSVGNRLPYLEAVAITFLPEKQSEFLEFVQGNIDFISGLAPSYKDDILNPDGTLNKRYEQRVRMETSPYLNTEYIGFYMDAAVGHPENSIWIRKAVNYGFDRNAVNSYLRNNMVIPAVHGFIPQGLPSFSGIAGYSYQPDKARQLVNKYIEMSGDKHPKITISTDNNYLDICEYIQRELKKTGLEVVIDVSPAASLKQAKANGKVTVFRASWIADYPDAENYLSLFYSKNFAPGGANYTHFKNPEFDRLYETALEETSLKKRHALYRQMDSLVISEAPVAVLYYDKAIRFSRNNVRGLGINPINLLNLKKTYKEKQ